MNEKWPTCICGGANPANKGLPRLDIVCPQCDSVRASEAGIKALEAGDFVTLEELRRQSRAQGGG